MQFETGKYQLPQIYQYEHACLQWNKEDLKCRHAFYKQFIMWWAYNSSYHLNQTTMIFVIVCCYQNMSQKQALSMSNLEEE